MPVRVRVRGGAELDDGERAEGKEEEEGGGDGAEQGGRAEQRASQMLWASSWRRVSAKKKRAR